MPPSDFSSLRAVAEKLTAYRKEYEAVRDKRAIFAYSYTVMTEFLLDDLERGVTKFNDPKWVEQIAVTFAGRFFIATDAITAGGEVPRQWSDYHKAIATQKSYVLEDLLYGMMAHIAGDLPLALTDIEAKPEHVDDYHRMNSVLASCIDQIQDKVAQRYSRMLWWLDRWTGAFDELLTNYGIRLARSVSWYNYDRMLQPTSRESALETVATSTGNFIQFARRPNHAGLRFLIAVARVLIPPRRRWPKPGE